ncbi:MAG: hypothetical protein AABY07_08030 [Nanoarchaeota archaeon]
MTQDEKQILKELKKDLVILRLQMKVLTGGEFKKRLDKVLKGMEGLVGENV